MNDICKTQQSFARKAQAQPEHRFGDMYHLICQEEWLTAALMATLSNTGSQTAGIDGVNRQSLPDETAQHKFIHDLQTELKTKTYQPQPVRRHWIPKANGKLRPLGIPTLKDRVVQMALKMLLEPIWESDFLDCSNGFQPGRRTMDCISTCRSRITTQNNELSRTGSSPQRYIHPHLSQQIGVVILDVQVSASTTSSRKPGYMGVAPPYPCLVGPEPQVRTQDLAGLIVLSPIVKPRQPAQTARLRPAGALVPSRRAGRFLTWSQ